MLECGCLLVGSLAVGFSFAKCASLPHDEKISLSSCAKIPRSSGPDLKQQSSQTSANAFGEPKLKATERKSTIKKVPSKLCAQSEAQQAKIVASNNNNNHNQHKLENKNESKTSIMKINNNTSKNCICKTKSKLIGSSCALCAAKGGDMSACPDKSFSINKLNGKVGVAKKFGEQQPPSVPETAPVGKGNDESGTGAAGGGGFRLLQNAVESLTRLFGQNRGKRSPPKKITSPVAKFAQPQQSAQQVNKFLSANKLQPQQTLAFKFAPKLVTSEQQQQQQRRQSNKTTAAIVTALSDSSLGKCQASTGFGDTDFESKSGINQYLTEKFEAGHSTIPDFGAEITDPFGGAAGAGAGAGAICIPATTAQKMKTL